MNLVIKLSGKVLDEPPLSREICRQIHELWTQGHRVTVVHGAGRQLTLLSTQLGIPVRQFEGRRVTDQKTLEVANMVFSAVNRTLVAGLVALGLRAIGMTGFDAGITRAVRRGPIRVKDQEGVTREIDFGYVADLKAVQPDILDQLFDLRCLPVICSLCADDSGQILNINADTLAAELAAVLRSDRLISVSDVDGIYLDPGNPQTRIARMTAEEARRYLAEGCFTEGMVPKVQTALKAVEGGVAGFLVTSGTKPNAVIEALAGTGGTLLVA